VKIGEVFGMYHQLGGSTEDNMDKMSVIGHFFHRYICLSITSEGNSTPCIYIRWKWDPI